MRVLNTTIQQYANMDFHEEFLLSQNPTLRANLYAISESSHESETVTSYQHCELRMHVVANLKWKRKQEQNMYKYRTALNHS